MLITQPYTSVAILMLYQQAITIHGIHNAKYNMPQTSIGNRKTLSTSNPSMVHHAFTIKATTLYEIIQHAFPSINKPCKQVYNNHIACSISNIYIEINHAYTMHIKYKAFQACISTKHTSCIKIYLNEIERELRYPPKPSGEEIYHSTRNSRHDFLHASSGNYKEDNHKHECFRSMIKA